jgi:hypothetical protein
MNRIIQLNFMHAYLLNSTLTINLDCQNTSPCTEMHSLSWTQKIKIDFTSKKEECFQRFLHILNDY